MFQIPEHPISTTTQRAHTCEVAVRAVSGRTRPYRAGPSCRINRINCEFVFQDLRGAVDIGTAIFHLLDALAKLGEVFCDGSRTARLARGQNVQGNTFREMKFEFLSILVRGNLGKAGSAIGNPDAPKRLALYRESNCYVGIGRQKQRGELAFGPPVRNGRSCGRPAQTIDFTRGREPFGGIGGREVRDGLSERARHVALGIVA